MRTAALFAVVIAIGAAIGIGLKQASDDGDANVPDAVTLDQAQVDAKLSGAPAPLAALHAQSNDLLGGGKRSLDARLKEVKGHPAVVNVWASWCGPCNAEAPVLQHVALDRGRDVAFVGVDLKDDRDGARGFLRRYPATYPSYEDPDGRIYNAYRLSGAPATIFYDSAGRKTFTHQGPYLNVADLQRDIDRYAVGGDQRS